MDERDHLHLKGRVCAEPRQYGFRDFRTNMPVTMEMPDTVLVDLVALRLSNVVEQECHTYQVIACGFIYRRCNVAPHIVDVVGAILLKANTWLHFRDDVYDLSLIVHEFPLGVGGHNQFFEPFNAVRSL